MFSVGSFECTLPEGGRVLLLAPGPWAGDALKLLGGKPGQHAWTCLDSRNVSRLNTPFVNHASKPATCVLGRAPRLPFRRHSFQAVVALEALFAIRPPWTVIAEFHRVLVPDGTLVLVEPAREGFFSKIRSRLLGPGKRVFALDEVKARLARADFAIARGEELPAASGYPRHAYLVAAIKKENMAEPVPQVTTTREMRAKQRPYPKGEELP